MDFPVGIQLYNAPIDGIGAPLYVALTIIRKVFELARTSVRFSSSRSRSRVRRFSVILRLAARLKWWDANTFTSSCSTTIDSSWTHLRFAKGGGCHRLDEIATPMEFETDFNIS
jgi:hypothetical protein